MRVHVKTVTVTLMGGALALLGCQNSSDLPPTYLSGLRVLIEAKQLAAEHGTNLWLVCHSASANLVLDGSGLREHFTFVDSVALAVGQ